MSFQLKNRCGSVDREYELEERTPIGGQGTVYRAQDVDMDQVVVVKVINRRWEQAPVCTFSIHMVVRSCSS